VYLSLKSYLFGPNILEIGALLGFGHVTSIKLNGLEPCLGIGVGVDVLHTDLWMILNMLNRLIDS
jgi:hypothetical protein